MRAIPIDGVNLYNMGRALGFYDGIDHAALLDILTHVGAAEPAQRALKPFITISPNTPPTIENFLRKAGYEVLVVSTENSADDKALIEWIRDLPPEVDEIFAVTADADFIEILDEKVRAGIAVTIVSTHAGDVRTGKPVLSGSYGYRINAGQYGFMDLGEIRDRIEYRRPEVKFQGIRLEIEGGNPGEMLQLISDIAPQLSEAMARFPGIRWRIKEPWDLDKDRRSTLARTE